LAKNRRRNVLINPQFQVKFIIYLNIILFVCLSLYSWIILDVGEVLVDANLITEVKASEMNARILPLIFIVHAVIHVVMTVVMLFVSHRIAGPLVRFKNVIKSLIKNDYLAKPFNTRKHDYFNDLRDEINHLNVKMREDYLNKQELINALTPVLQENISPSTKKTIEELVKKHQ
jgi:hypothetical protein